MNETASKIAKARLAAKRLEDYPGAAPADMAQAYSVQDDMIKAMGLPVVGWKVGATGAIAREMLGIDEPFAGPLFDTLVTTSPSTLSVDEGDLRIVEAEIAFKMKASVGPRDKPYVLDEITPHIGTVHPVFEIVNKRLPGTLKENVCWLVADGGVNQSFVYGTGVEFNASMDLSAETVEVAVNGETVTKGIGSNALGNPLDVVVWLANNLSQRGITLNAGDWISTGLLCDVVILELGASMKADYSSLGSVSLDFS